MSAEMIHECTHVCTHYIMHSCTVHIHTSTTKPRTEPFTYLTMVSLYILTTHTEEMYILGIPSNFLLLINSVYS